MVPYSELTWTERGVTDSCRDDVGAALWPGMRMVRGEKGEEGTF